MLVLCTSVLSFGCFHTATVGTSESVSVPADARESCEMLCEKIGMRLGAVAIMANNVGCICDLRETVDQATTSAVSAGMATVSIQEIARQQQLLQQQQQQQQQQLQQQQRQQQMQYRALYR